MFAKFLQTLTHKESGHPEMIPGGHNLWLKSIINCFINNTPVFVSAVVINKNGSQFPKSRLLMVIP